MKVDRASADTWAPWFRCLGDPSRILILNRLALARRAMTVGELVDMLDIGQSTVSHHLKVLTDTGFVLLERRGTSSHYRVNDRCLDCFPSAAEVVMGRLPRYRSQGKPRPAPWFDQKTGGRRGRGGERRRTQEAQT